MLDEQTVVRCSNRSAGQSRSHLPPETRRAGKARHGSSGPVAVEALGRNGNNVSTEVWWSPSHPFRSSLTGQSAREIAAAYEQATRKQWTQPIGFVHALFEVAVDVLKRSAGTDPKAVVAAIAATRHDTVVGRIERSGCRRRSPGGTSPRPR